MTIIGSTCRIHTTDPHQTAPPSSTHPVPIQPQECAPRSTSSPPHSDAVSFVHPRTLYEYVRWHAVRVRTLAPLMVTLVGNPVGGMQSCGPRSHPTRAPLSFKTFCVCRSPEQTIPVDGYPLLCLASQINPIRSKLIHFHVDCCCKWLERLEGFCPQGAAAGWAGSHAGSTRYYSTSRQARPRLSGEQLLLAAQHTCRTGQPVQPLWYGSAVVSHRARASVPQFTRHKLTHPTHTKRSGQSATAATSAPNSKSSPREI